MGGIESYIVYASRSHHMRSYHLPDEKCPKCDAEVRPDKMYDHMRKCGVNIQRATEKEPCPICGKELHGNIARHIAKVHGKETKKEESGDFIDILDVKMEVDDFFTMD